MITDPHDDDDHAHSPECDAHFKFAIAKLVAALNADDLLGFVAVIVKKDGDGEIFVQRLSEMEMMYAGRDILLASTMQDDEDHDHIHEGGNA